MNFLPTPETNFKSIPEAKTYQYKYMPNIDYEILYYPHNNLGVYENKIITIFAMTTHLGTIKDENNNIIDYDIEYKSLKTLFDDTKYIQHYKNKKFHHDEILNNIYDNFYFHFLILIDIPQIVDNDNNINKTLTDLISIKYNEMYQLIYTGLIKLGIITNHTNNNVEYIENYFRLEFFIPQIHSNQLSTRNYAIQYARNLSAKLNKECYLKFADNDDTHCPLYMLCYLVEKLKISDKYVYIGNILKGNKINSYCIKDIWDSPGIWRLILRIDENFGFSFDTMGINNEDKRFFNYLQCVYDINKFEFDNNIFISKVENIESETINLIYIYDDSSGDYKVKKRIKENDDNIIYLYTQNLIQIGKTMHVDIAEIAKVNQIGYIQLNLATRLNKTYYFKFSEFFDKISFEKVIKCNNYEKKGMINKLVQTKISLNIINEKSPGFYMGENNISYNLNVKSISINSFKKANLPDTYEQDFHNFEIIPVYSYILNIFYISYYFASALKPLTVKLDITTGIIYDKNQKLKYNNYNDWNKHILNNNTNIIGYTYNENPNISKARYDPNIANMFYGGNINNKLLLIFFCILLLTIIVIIISVVIKYTNCNICKSKNKNMKNK